MKNKIDSKIVALESLMAGISHLENKFKHSSPEHKMFNELKEKKLSKLTQEIVALHERKAPNHEGPFRLKCKSKTNGRYDIYLTSICPFDHTPHIQDAKVWKTAAGAERALDKLDEHFNNGSSFIII